MSLKLGNEDDSYAEDDFEQAESFGSGSNKFSPKKSGDKIENEEEISGDLEKYIMEMKINPDPDRISSGEENVVDPIKVTQSLDGVKPSKENSEHLQLGERLGYNERPLTNVNDEETSAHSNPLDFIQKNHISPPRNVKESSPRSEQSFNNGPSEAQKVESLLIELFPDKYGKKKPAKSKKNKLPEASVASSSGLKLDLFHDPEPEANGATDVLSTLDTQLKLLKRELKVKDEKIARLTEHSVMMAGHMDRLKNEITKYQQRLREAALEIENKDAQLADALKAKRKAKKVVSKSSPMVDRAGAVALENELQRLREREQALLDAVEELSSQNEDLIIKLRESMQRELELSSKRAALVSHTVMQHNGNSTSLPNIHEREHHHYHGEQVRTQSEPSSSDAPQKRGKKKGKG